MRPWGRIEFGYECGTGQTRTAASGNIGHLMQGLLPPLDLDCYRSALLVARSELERLRQERLTCLGVGTARGL